VKRRLLIILISVFISCLIFGQDTTSVKSSKLKTGYITSGALLATGLIIDRESTRVGVRDWIRERFGITDTNFDDLLQHSPIAMLYISDLAFGHDKQTIGRHTRHLIVTQALTLGTSLALKGLTNSPRPNGGSHTFPSGHTAYAFASAGVIYQSFKDKNLWLAYSGYIPATVVGAFRMIKDKHWVSDVVFGAGLGILMSHLTYHIDLWHSKTDRKPKGLTSVNIRLGMSASGVGLSATF